VFVLADAICALLAAILSRPTIGDRSSSDCWNRGRRIDAYPARITALVLVFGKAIRAVALEYH
jgi:hypothetical protein